MQVNLRESARKRRERQIFCRKVGTNSDGLEDGIFYYQTHRSSYMLNNDDDRDLKFGAENHLVHELGP